MSGLASPFLAAVGAVAPAGLQSSSHLPALMPVLQSLPDLLSVEAIAFYVGSLLGLGGLKYYLKRRRQSTVGAKVDATDLLEVGTTSQTGPGTTVRTVTPEEDSDQVIKQTAHGHSRKSNVAFTLPEFLPLSKGIRSVTHDEIHAMELGFVVGLILLWLYSIERVDLTVTILAVFVAGTLGYKRYRSKAFKTVRYEPWYALLTLALGAAVGYVLFVVGIAIP